MSKKIKRKKYRTVIALIGCLAVLAVASVSVAVVTAVGQGKAEFGDEVENGLLVDAAAAADSENGEQILFDAADIRYEEEDALGVSLDELQPEIEDIIEDIKARAGGEWSVYVIVPKTGDTLSINQKKMQAASVIKLFVMGAVYDNYDEICENYPYDDIDSLIESMITISDNEATDLLVTMLGQGDGISGREVVNKFCKDNGCTNTVMDRMMGDDNVYSDNYTTTEDCAKILQKMYNGEFEHSKEMMHHIGNQTRVNKIPEGVPDNVRVANKTGELDDVQNDCAVVYTKYPYIICVMSDGVEDYQPPIDAIVDISSATYNYISGSM